MILEYTNTPNDGLVVKLCGEMDALGCTQIRTELEQIGSSETSKDVVLDLRQVSFLDSSGIGVIVFLYKRLKAQNCTLEITGALGQPLELMKLLRIDKAIPVNMVSPVNSMVTN